MLCIQMQGSASLHPARASDPDKIPKLNSRNNKGGGGGARTRRLRYRDTTAWLDIPFCFNTDRIKWMHLCWRQLIIQYSAFPSLLLIPEQETAGEAASHHRCGPRQWHPGGGVPHLRDQPRPRPRPVIVTRTLLLHSRCCHAWPPEQLLGSLPRPRPRPRHLPRDHRHLGAGLPGVSGELWLAESGSRDRGAHLWLVQVGAQHQDAVRELGRVCGGGAAVRGVRVRAVPGQAALPRQLSQVAPTIQYNKLRHCCLHGTRIKGDYEYLCTKFCITIIKVDGNGKCKLLQNDTNIIWSDAFRFC